MPEQSNSISDLHSQFNSPEEMVFNLVKKHTLHTPTNRKKLIKGYENEVYEVKTQEGNSYIVRIKRDSESSFEAETWAMKQCEQRSIKVPKVYGFGALSLDSQETEFMVLEKLEGLTIADSIETFSQEQIKEVWINAGKILRQIHQIKVDGFYKRESQGKWDFPSWEAFQTANIQDRAKERQFLIESGFTNEEIAKMMDLLKAYRDEFTCHQPVLCHGDFLQEHIFIDGELNITGIIDFGMYQGNHPIHDFARLYMDSRFKNMDALKEGYGESEFFDTAFEHRLLLHTLGLQIGNLAYYMKKMMKPESEWSKGRLQETLKLLERN